MTGRAGFSLIEALIALTISSILVMLVGAVFLAQNDFYAHVLLRSQVQENARAMTELVASEVRSIASGAVIVADSTRLVIRVPLAMAMVCGDHLGQDAAVRVLGGTSGFTTGDVAGFGYRAANGAWTYYDNTWSQLLASGGNPDQACRSKGADTTGVSAEFFRMDEVPTDTGIGVLALLGSPLMIYRKTEFKFNDSALIDGARALFRGSYGGTLTELATGLSDSARFEYWTGSSWVKSVTGGTLASITRIRLVAESEGVGGTSQQAGYEFGWTVDIPVANVL